MWRGDAAVLSNEYTRTPGVGAEGRSKEAHALSSPRLHSFIRGEGRSCGRTECHQDTVALRGCIVWSFNKLNGVKDVKSKHWQLKYQS